MAYFFALFSVFASLVFVIDHFQKRSSQPPVVAPPSKWSNFVNSPKVALVGAAIGVIGLLVLVGRFGLGY